MSLSNRGEVERAAYSLRKASEIYKRALDELRQAATGPALDALDDKGANQVRGVLDFDTPELESAYERVRLIEDSK